MDKYTYGNDNTKKEILDLELKPNHISYPNLSRKDNKFAIDYPINIASNYSIPHNNNDNLELHRQITKFRTENKSFKDYIKSIKKSFLLCFNQYRGLSFREKLFKFIYNLSHTGITIGTLIYCCIFIIIVGGTLLSEYHIEYLIIIINSLIGILSLLFNILPIILLFDYLTSCCGCAFFINSSWKINGGYSNIYSSSLFVFGLAMILIIPFRIFWWHKYYPNKFAAMDVYTDLAKNGYFDKDTIKNEIN